MVKHDAHNFPRYNEPMCYNPHYSNPSHHTQSHHPYMPNHTPYGTLGPMYPSHPPNNPLSSTPSQLSATTPPHHHHHQPDWIASVKDWIFGYQYVSIIFGTAGGIIGTIGICYVIFRNLLNERLAELAIQLTSDTIESQQTHKSVLVLTDTIIHDQQVLNSLRDLFIALLGEESLQSHLISTSQSLIIENVLKSPEIQAQLVELLTLLLQDEHIQLELRDVIAYLLQQPIIKDQLIDIAITTLQDDNLQRQTSESLVTLWTQFSSSPETYQMLQSLLQSILSDQKLIDESSNMMWKTVKKTFSWWGGDKDKEKEHDDKKGHHLYHSAQKAPQNTTNQGSVGLTSGIGTDGYGEYSREYDHHNNFHQFDNFHSKTEQPSAQKSHEKDESLKKHPSITPSHDLIHTPPHPAPSSPSSPSSPPSQQISEKKNIKDYNQYISQQHSNQNDPRNNSKSLDPRSALENEEIFKNQPTTNWTRQLSPSPITHTTSHYNDHMDYSPEEEGFGFVYDAEGDNHNVDVDLLRKEKHDEKIDDKNIRETPSMMHSVVNWYDNVVDGVVGGYHTMAGYFSTPEKHRGSEIGEKIEQKNKQHLFFLEQIKNNIEKLSQNDFFSSAKQRLDTLLHKMNQEEQIDHNSEKEKDSSVDLNGNKIIIDQKEQQNSPNIQNIENAQNNPNHSHHNVVQNPQNTPNNSEQTQHTSPIPSPQIPLLSETSLQLNPPNQSLTSPPHLERPTQPIILPPNKTVSANLPEKPIYNLSKEIKEMGSPSSQSPLITSHTNTTHSSPIFTLHLQSPLNSTEVNAEKGIKNQNDDSKK